MFLDQPIVHREDAYHLTQPARLCRVQTKQADVVDQLVAKRIVGVKRALGVSDGETGAVAHILAGVAHVIEQRALHVLHDGAAEQLTHEPVDRWQFLGRITLGWHTVDNDEAAAGFQLVADRLERHRPSAE